MSIGPRRRGHGVWGRSNRGFVSTFGRCARYRTDVETYSIRCTAPGIRSTSPIQDCRTSPRRSLIKKAFGVSELTVALRRGLPPYTECNSGRFTHVPGRTIQADGESTEGRGGSEAKSIRACCCTSIIFSGAQRATSNTQSLTGALGLLRDMRELALAQHRCRQRSGRQDHIESKSYCVFRFRWRLQTSVAGLQEVGKGKGWHRSDNPPDRDYSALSVTLPDSTPPQHHEIVNHHLPGTGDSRLSPPHVPVLDQEFPSSTAPSSALPPAPAPYCRCHA